MDRNSEEYQQMRDKALSQLRSGESLTGKDGAFGPLLKEFLEAALDGEMSSHLDDSERLKGNKRNGRVSKRVKTMAGARIKIGSSQSGFLRWTARIRLNPIATAESMPIQFGFTPMAFPMRL